MSDAHRTQPQTPPSPPGKPIVGNTLAYARDPLAFIRRTAADYGPVTVYEVGGETIYQLSDPALVERVLVHDNEHYVKGDLFQDALRPVLGNGLLTSEGEFWRDQRHTIRPAFAPDALDAYAPTMIAYTERLLDDWRDGETRNVHADMMRLTVEIAAKALFDIDIREEESAVADALEAVMDRVSASLRRPVDVPDWLPTRANRRYQQALTDLGDVADTIIAERADARERGAERDENGPPDVVGLLLDARDAGAPITHEQLRDEVVTILLAGHETTALALTYTLHALGETPTAESRLHAELDDALDGPPTADALDDLPFVEQCITEGMRRYPPVWELLRETTRPETYDGYGVPAGATIAVQQWVLHHDDRYYDDPWTFRPDRWTSDFRQSLPAFAYFPFGGGPRRCIGDRFAMLEARLVLATIAREWRLHPEADLSFAPSITLRPEDAVEMTLDAR